MQLSKALVEQSVLVLVSLYRSATLPVNLITTIVINEIEEPQTKTQETLAIFFFANLSIRDGVESEHDALRIFDQSYENTGRGMTTSSL